MDRDVGAAVLLVLTVTKDWIDLVRECHKLYKCGTTRPKKWLTSSTTDYLRLASIATVVLQTQSKL